MPFIIIDVEGTDGVERGDDQNFERRSSLFALAISHVLIINIWGHTIGLYNSSNLGLLKVVLESHIASLKKSDGIRTVLLFVVRDYVDVMNSKALEQKLREDIGDLWEKIYKPETFQGQMSDIFTLKFAFLHNKLTQNEQFGHDVHNLYIRFCDPMDLGYIFHNQPFSNVSLDEFGLYMEMLWNRVTENQDIDLPTQQELLASFRCDQISSVLFEGFKSRVDWSDAREMPGGFKRYFEEDRKETLVAYDEQVLRYNKLVSGRKRKELVENINREVKMFFDMKIDKLAKKTLLRFEIEFSSILKDQNSEYLESLVKIRTVFGESFVLDAKSLILSETDWSYEFRYKELVDDMNKKAEMIRDGHVKEVLKEVTKKYKEVLKYVICEEFERGKLFSWKSILNEYCVHTDSMLDTLCSKLDMLGILSNVLIEEKRAAIERAWNIFIKLLEECLADALLMKRLERIFDTMFRYDEKGFPRTWTGTSDVDKTFFEAVDTVEKYIQDVSTLKVSNLSESVLPETFKTTYQFVDKERRLYLYEMIKRKADGIYLEAKRSVIKTRTSVPVWILVLLIVLGWEKILWVLTSPIWLVFFCILGVVIYVLHLFGMTSLIEMYFFKILPGMCNRLFSRTSWPLTGDVRWKKD